MVARTTSADSTGATSPDRTRRQNLSTVLRAVHHSGGLSRADLTRLTGLNRSTIGTLVKRLDDLGLVVEKAPTQGGSVGRPSPVVEPDRHVVALAVNPDVDAVTVGLVGLGGRLVAREVVPTDAIPSVEDAVAIASERARSMLAAAHVKLRLVGATVAVPGLVRRDDGVVAYAPHLGWHDAPVAEPFAVALKCPVRVANDASAALLAETHFGVGRGVRNLIYLNGSTSGIGGGAVVGGKLLHGARGFAAEFGHMVLDLNGERCSCGRRGCLETFVNLQRLEAVTGVEARNIDHSVIGGAVDDLPEVVAAEVGYQLDALAQAVANLAAAFDPDLVILGGFLGALIDGRSERMQAAVSSHAFAPLAEHLRVERAGLREGLLSVGAAELAFEPLFRDPDDSTR